MNKHQLLMGKRFSRLIVTGIVKTGQHGTHAKVVCDCGTKRIVRLSGLKYGNTKSCGCLRSEVLNKRNKGKVPKIGTIFGSRRVVAVKSADGTVGRTMCDVVCVCGHKSSHTLHALRNTSMQQCRKCAHAQHKKTLSERSLFSRPVAGKMFGSRIVIDPSLWKEMARGREASCLTKCNKCGDTRIFLLRLLRQKPKCQSCRNRNFRQVHLAEGIKLFKKYSKSVKTRTTLRSEMLEWAARASVPKTKTIPCWKTPLVSLFKPQLDLLIPLDPNTPCFWPWDDEGKPLALDKHGKIKKTKAGKNAGKKPK